MKKIINHFKENWIRHGFETLYVIVGILIAFSLNDWNEDRKARITEISILNELITGLSSDSSSLDFNIAQHNQAIKSCEIVLKALNEVEEYHDSLVLRQIWGSVILTEKESPFSAILQPG